jgi:hypothetical protein
MIAYRRKEKQATNTTAYMHKQHIFYVKKGIYIYIYIYIYIAHYILRLT